MTVGKRIKEYRKSKGWTQKQLAVKSGVAEITIRQYESENRTPKTEKLQQIALALGIPINTLLGISTEQLLQPLKDEVAFLNYLLSFGYEYVDMFYDNDYGYDRCIHIIAENKDIPLTKTEYDNLKKNIQNDIEQEITRLRQYKNI